MADGGEHSSIGRQSAALTEEHVAQFLDRGYVVVGEAYPEALRAELAAAVRRDLPPWEQAQASASLPDDRVGRDQFPYAQQILNRFIVDPQLLGFVRRALQTDHIHFRYAHNWVRYPLVGATVKASSVHRDHGNNSLLPPNDDVRYGQVSCWYFPEAVADDQAPMLIVPKEYGADVARGVRLVVPAGTLMLFNTQLWHSATPFRATTGQRYSITRIYGRADHYWEGVGFITSLGSNQYFREFIGGLTATERGVFRFPPPGHPYYTPEALAALEVQYPSWNARGEYGLVATEQPDPPPLSRFPLPAE